MRRIIACIRRKGRWKKEGGKCCDFRFHLWIPVVGGGKRRKDLFKAAIVDRNKRRRGKGERISLCWSLQLCHSAGKKKKGWAAERGRLING